MTNDLVKLQNVDPAVLVKVYDGDESVYFSSASRSLGEGRGSMGNITQ